MATTVVKTIGTAGGRDYSTLQAWEDASPASLVAVDQVWRGEAYNDTEFSLSSVGLSIDGQTTDATRYMELTAAAGQSFQDKADIRTHALAYDATRGVSVTKAGNYTPVIKIGVDYTRLSRLQVNGAQFNNSCIQFGSAHPMNCTFRDLICRAASGSWIVGFHNGTLVVNVLGIADQASGGSFATWSGATTFVGCVAVRTTSNPAAGQAFSQNYPSGGDTLISCAVFGFTAIHAGQLSASSKNNATDLATGLPGTANQHAVPFSAVSPFTQGSNSGTDLRAIVGTALAAHGFLDARAPNDLSKTARGASPTIGAWEAAAAPTGGGGGAKDPRKVGRLVTLRNFDAAHQTSGKPKSGQVQPARITAVGAGTDVTVKVLAKTGKTYTVPKWSKTARAVMGWTR